MIASPQDRVKHCFVKEAVTHPFRDNDVNVFYRKNNFFNFASEAAISTVSLIKWKRAQ